MALTKLACTLQHSKVTQVWLKSCLLFSQASLTRETEEGIYPCTMLVLKGTKKLLSCF
uniref:Uncharacterized protein n=1 Tax=Rhizophora mucronata TaxID=61149 RepID=A0A2P2IRE9_RHIMU